jgi:phosphate transport system permease protein
MDARLKTRNSKSAAFKVVVVFFAFLVTIPLIVILLYIVKQGIMQVNWHFLVDIPAPVGEKGGGIANALIGSVIVVGVSSIIAIPIGMLAGIYLSENPGTKLAYFTGRAIHRCRYCYLFLDS